MAKIKLDDDLLERARQVAIRAGYSGLEEFIAHCVEQEVRRLTLDDAEQVVANQLRGLGYIE